MRELALLLLLLCGTSCWRQLALDGGARGPQQEHGAGFDVDAQVDVVNTD